MNRIYKAISITMMTLSLLSSTWAQQRTSSSNINPQPAVTTTAGRIAKFVSVGVVGDSNISEDKFGNVGIGTATPTSSLTVQGMIEITLGGLKFPDGTVQTSAPNTNVVHDETLKGNGSTANPLGIIVPLSLSGSAASASILSVKPTSGDYPALDARGADGGIGAYAAGGFDPDSAGPGMFGDGGASFGAGGPGVIGRGGNGSVSTGIGVVGRGGTSAIAKRSGSGMEGTGGDAFGAGHTAGDGVVGFAGVGFDGATKGKAGRFDGDVQVTGTLAKAGGSFKIDHPLDPENKYLSHSFVESPDMMNIYNGNIITDESGRAIVELPVWFEALNQDFRYQLTVVGQFAQAIVSEKVKGNRFAIQTSAPGVEVSWQVTGIRHDAWANKNRIKVEEDKSEKERGHYLHPAAFDQPDAKNVLMVWYPERQNMKHLSQEADQKRQLEQQR